MLDSDKLIEAGRRVFATEIRALENTEGALDESFARICGVIASCKGKVAFIGMGKPGRVNGKVAATFCSLGIPAFVLHPGEAQHGDLGVLQPDDLAIVVSYSGESDEVVGVLPSIRRKASLMVAVTGRADSRLAKAADIVQVLPHFAEADPLGLAPTSSTTVWIAYADALAVAVSSSRGFTREDFGSNHPAGSLGKGLLYRVDDLMRSGERNAVVAPGDHLTSAIVRIGETGFGMACVADEEGDLVGVITDGDLRRQIERRADVYSLIVSDAMTADPVTVQSGTMAVDALALMRNRNVAGVPVLDGRRVVGSLPLQDIVDAGIVL